MNVHFRHIILCIVASCLFAACQDTDVPAIQDNEETGRAENTVTTYLRVNLATVGESSSRGETGGYKKGTTKDNPDNIDEASVKRVDFYFFEEDGDPYERNVNGSNIFVLNSPDKTESTTDNVESQWGPVLTMMLKEEDVEKGNYPALMMAVVNSDQIYSGKTLGEIEAVVVNTPMNDKNVLMTSSSFYDADESENSNTHPYAVKISAENFGSSYAEAMTNAVDVYVERLAAKVTLKTKENFSWADENNQVVKIANISYQANKTRTAYIKLRAWGLNSTAKQSRLMKQINNEWKFEWGRNSSWNNVTDHRSYWGKSLNYDYVNTNYATSDKDNFDNFVLTYHTLNEINTTIGNSQYTMEHTPSKDHIADMDNRACVTEAILVAEFLGFGDYKNDGTITEPLEAEGLYRIGDAYWYGDDLLQQLLYDFNATKGLNVWKKDQNDDTKYIQADASYFEFVDKGDGYVRIGLKSFDNLYYKDGDNYTLYTDNDTYQTKFNTTIKEFNTVSVDPLFINGYRDGMMYYHIPIEHLADTGEGQYGVVRNHWYQITVNSITTLGHGVFNPAEEIVPLPREHFYGLSFEMQVCPWHVKEYNITLDGTN